MAKKFKKKVHEYDAHEFKLDDNDRPDWLTEAIASNKVVIHADHAIVYGPTLGPNGLRANPGDWFIQEPPDHVYVAPKNIFPRVFEEKP